MPTSAVNREYFLQNQDTELEKGDGTGPGGALGKLFNNPLNHGGGGGAVRPSLSFGLLLKIIFRHPYLKILDLASLFVADAPMKKKSRNLVLPPSQSTLKYGLTGHGLEG